ncbi:hypothetical protein [Neisseria montereyensis]|uniref:Uncharacterized protein n=1 Tax=Neisseria montereyensis TaxID=2973938 RepID=A0ABT2FB18_9NEIS|nr:hypothetical protein [Neisseria montereyensis]MCS4532934.1 hypothetical protein [Neisseria montereyensis]
MWYSHARGFYSSNQRVRAVGIHPTPERCNGFKWFFVGADYISARACPSAMQPSTAHAKTTQSRLYFTDNTIQTTGGYAIRPYKHFLITKGHLKHYLSDGLYLLSFVSLAVGCVA